MKAWAALLALAGSACAASVPTSVNLDVDWASFLARSDLLWNWTGSSAPQTWQDGGFFGNGLVGGCVYFPSTNLLEVHVSRTDLYDDRSGASNLSVGNNFVFDRPRLPIGLLHVEWSGADTLASAWMRMELWNGLIQGSLSFASGTSLSFALFAQADPAVGRAIVLNTATSYAGSGSSSPLTFSLSYLPLAVDSTWHAQSSSYQPNPVPEYIPWSAAGVPSTVVVQPHLTGSEHAIGLATTGSGVSAPTSPSTSGSNPYGPFTPGHVVQLSVPSTATTVVVLTPVGTNQGNLATALLSSAITQLPQQLPASSAWWNAFWSGVASGEGSFVTWEQSWMESFYYIQIYKFACATGDNIPGTYAVHDLQGPFTALPQTDWPDLHWYVSFFGGGWGGGGWGCWEGMY
jgi:hypothetical protein